MNSKTIMVVALTAFATPALAQMSQAERQAGIQRYQDHRSAIAAVSKTPRDKLKLAYHRAYGLKGCQLSNEQNSHAEGAVLRTEKWNLKQDPSINKTALLEEAKVKIPSVDEFESQCIQKYNALVLDAPMCTDVEECRKVEDEINNAPQPGIPCDQARAASNSGYAANCMLSTTLSQLHRDGKIDNDLKIKYDGNGFIEGVWDTRGNLYVPNMLAFFPESRSDTQKMFVYAPTPARRLPDCDSAEIVPILAKVNRTTLSGLFYLKKMGSNNGRNICSVGIAFRGRWTYTIEWLDETQGRFWVQMTGRV